VSDLGKVNQLTPWLLSVDRWSKSKPRNEGARGGEMSRIPDTARIVNLSGVGRTTILYVHGSSKTNKLQYNPSTKISGVSDVLSKPYVKQQCKKLLSTKVTERVAP
jgi:hypothetical protein